MDYSIRVYKVDKEDSRLRGFVSITFDGAFCAKSIALKESAKGRLYLEMPKYLDYESQEYLPFFSFKDADFRKAVTEQVVDAYEEIKDKWGFGRAGMKIRRTLKQTLIITISGMLIPGKTFIRSRGAD